MKFLVVQFVENGPFNLHTFIKKKMFNGLSSWFDGIVIFTWFGFKTIQLSVGSLCLV